MLTCREVTALCSQELERRLGIREQVSLHSHLIMCSGCTNFRQQMKTLRQIMRAYSDGRSVSEDNIDPSADR